MVTSGSMSGGEAAGDDPGGGDDTPGPDAAEAAGTPDSGAAAADCTPAAGTLPNGNHNAGLTCIQAGCHNGAGVPPKWTIAGTVYTTLAGGAPVAGATVHVIDADGDELQLVTASNGNFYTAAPVTFPVTTRASKCPDSRPMVATVAETGASCNIAGCHDADLRITLP